MSVKENAKNSDTWLRGLFILVFGVIFYVLYGVIWLLVIFQFVTKVLTGALNQQLSDFSISLTRFAFQILRYITFQSEVRPFPFSSWPTGENGESEHDSGNDEDASEQITQVKAPTDSEN